MADRRERSQAERTRPEGPPSPQSSTRPGTTSVTYRDSERKLGPIGFFAKHPELNTILHKVVESGTAFIETLGITTSRAYRYTDKLYEDHPEALALRPEGNTALVNTNAFELFSFLYHDQKPSDGNEYVRAPRSDQEQARIPLASQ